VLALLCGVASTTALTAGWTEAVGPRLSLSQPLTVRWRYVGPTLNLTPAADDERIYLPLAGGTIVSLRASDGQLYWRSEIGGELSASPAADDRAVYVAASEAITSASETHRTTGSLRALSREGGVTLWMRTLAMPIRGGLTIGNDKIFGATSDGNVYGVDRKSGNILWSVKHGSAFNCQPVLSGRSVYAGSEDGTLFTLDESTGKLQWDYRTRGPVRGPVALADGTVYFGSGDGYVYAVNQADGQRQWRKRTGAGVQAVARVDRGLLVASLDNFAYLLSFSRGKKLWKRQLPGRISSQPLTAEDSALFTPLSSDAGVVLALRDGRQVNTLPTGEGINTASPIIVGDAVFITTEHGLLAFSHPTNTRASNY
jgi:eukaryotic-like serine/threonine-protein kinase